MVLLLLSSALRRPDHLVGLQSNRFQDPMSQCLHHGHDGCMQLIKALGSGVVLSAVRDLVSSVTQKTIN